MSTHHPSPTRSNESQEASPGERKRKERPERERPKGPPDPVLEKRIEKGADESDDLTS